MVERKAGQVDLVEWTGGRSATVSMLTAAKKWEWELVRAGKGLRGSRG